MQYNITYREKDKGIQVIISYKNQNGKWQQKSKQGFKKKGEAKKYADKMLEQLKENITFNPPSEFDGITFEEFGQRYLEHMRLYREPKTNESTKTVLNRFSGLNNLEMNKITALDIQEIVDEQTKEGLNSNTISYYLKKLTIIFNSAKHQYNIINSVPTKNVKVNKPKDINKKALTDCEVTKLLDTFKNNKYYLIVFLAVKTGMRIGEILGLKWSDIDFKSNIITVNKQWKKLKDGSYNFGELKTKNSNRIIPISHSTSKELLDFLKSKNVINIDKRILNFKNKESVISYVNSLLKKHDFDISIHELRHTFATKLIASGLDFKTAANILGHDISQTMKTYSHVNNDMMDKAKNLIEEFF
ncbi:tyrosine-type recombinase/integrase [Brassicibacter mesophilus]|uniref:site-specific integrase n=1 Tax=Brassicibacter mesophilus TaxID=745119 RepID=UPI003D1A9C4E